MVFVLEYFAASGMACIFGGILLGFKIGGFSVDFYSTYIPILLVLMPPLVVRYVFATIQSRGQNYWCGVGYLVGAGVSWVVSIYAPNIPIGHSESTTTHLIGGAFIVPFLYAYLYARYLGDALSRNVKEDIGLLFNPRWVRFAALFALSCMFGVVNELFEAALAGAHIMTIDSADTWNDLIVNAVGTVLAFVAMELWRSARKLRP
jgi:hypothetical protein